MFHSDKPLTFDINSPIMRACNAPQLMLHRHMGFSTWAKNRDKNNRKHEEWLKRHRTINGLTD